MSCALGLWTASTINQDIPTPFKRSDSRLIFRPASQSLPPGQAVRSAMLRASQPGTAWSAHMAGVRAAPQQRRPGRHPACGLVGPHLADIPGREVQPAQQTLCGVPGSRKFRTALSVLALRQSSHNMSTALSVQATAMFRGSAKFNLQLAQSAAPLHLYRQAPIFSDLHWPYQDHVSRLNCRSCPSLTALAAVD